MGAYEHKFKIGDRVRCIDDSNTSVTKFGKEYKVVDVGPRYLGVLVNGERRGMHIERFELVSPLTIEAGKFYKTRDGRKVGPVTVSGDGETAWGQSSDSYATVFTSTGLANRNGEHPDDFIAEWVDDPAEQTAVAVAASNDNAAPAKPAKFKVGDVVRFRDDYASSAAGNKATVIAVNVWGADGIQVDQGGYDGVSTEAEKDLELVVATKFKVGDRIKGSAPGIGPVTGAVVEVDADDDDMTYFVLPDGEEYPFWVYNNTVEPADPAVPAIVALIEDGQPKPATRPYVHATEESAANEADRLADLHKGQEFAVFVLTSSRKRAVPAYAFEWQRLAARGEKIAAIKELRAVTGMPLRQSKDVVEHFVDSPYGEIAA